MGEAVTAKGLVDVRRDADGSVWLMVPNAMLNVSNGLHAPIVRHAFLRWAEGVLGGAVAPEVERLRQWVADLQSGMWINCVYCGHRYGPADITPATVPAAANAPTMAEALRAHIEQCPDHPMSALKAENARLSEAVEQSAGAYNVLEEALQRFGGGGTGLNVQNAIVKLLERLTHGRDRKAELLASTIAVADARAAELATLRSQRRLMITHLSLVAPEVSAEMRSEIHNLLEECGVSGGGE